MTGAGSWLARIAGLGNGASRWHEAVGAIVDELKPRSLLLVGCGPEFHGLRGQCLTVFLRSAPLEADGHRVRRFDGNMPSFFGQSTRSQLMTPSRHASGAFCDLAVIGDGISENEADILVEQLHTVVLTSTAVVLPGHRRPLAERLMAARGGGSLVGIERRGAGMLVGGMPTRPGESRSAWLARHRVADPPPALPLATVPGAPFEPSRTVQPVYREVGGAPELMRAPNRGALSMAQWWGKPLQLLPAGIACGELVFQKANGLFTAVLVSANGGLHDASFVWRRGFGPDAASAARTPGATYLEEGARRRPLADAAALPVTRVVEDPMLLLGYIEPRFGHIITESFSRAWAIPWAVARGMRVLVWTRNDWTSLQEDALALLGLTPDRIEIAQPGTRYRALHVPSDGSRLWNSVSPLAVDGWRLAVANALTQSVAPPGGDPTRVYLSRRRIARRPLENEDEVEALLRADGFACVSPETLSLAEQVRLVSQAELVAGCYGSQMHLSAFANARAERLVIAPEHHLGPEELLFSIANGSTVSFYVEPQLRVSGGVMTAMPWRLDMARFLTGYRRWLAEAEARLAAQPSAAASAASPL